MENLGGTKEVIAALYLSFDRDVSIYVDRIIKCAYNAKCRSTVMEVNISNNSISKNYPNEICAMYENKSK